MNKFVFASFEIPKYSISYVNWLNIIFYYYRYGEGLR